LSTFGVLGCQQEAKPTADASPAASADGAASSGATTAGVPPKPEGTFKVGLITPGSTKTDKAWSGLAWDGVQRVAKETGAT
jgi:basic membrane lipoprotein Med (substrate-binding protein (PBP1-ABC) superfamily)